METQNLLHQSQEEIDDDDVDDEFEHPFLKTNYNKQSFTDSPTFKKALFFVITFMIAIFIGFIFGSSTISNSIAPANKIVFTTSSPTPSPEQLIIPSSGTIHKKYPSTPSPTTTTTTTTTTKPPTTTTTTTKPPTTTTTTTTKQPTTSTTTTTTTKSSTTTTTKAAITTTTKAATTTTTKAAITNTTSKPSSTTTTKATMNTSSSTSTTTTTTSTATSATAEKIVIGDKDDDKVSFVLTPLSAGPENIELAKLELNFDTLLVNEKGMKTQRDEPFYGPMTLNYKYPKNGKDQYGTNEIRRNCYNLRLHGNAMINYVIIQIKFNKFELENGFDRVLIRHFNDSFIDVPLSYTGYQTNLSMQYLMEKNTTKSVCIEFQSDDTITDNGIDYDVSILYDLCEWSDWDPCYTMNLWGKRWSRGPFMNGKCGLGVTSRSRLNKLGDAKNKIKGVIKANSNGILQRCDDTNILQKHGPEYCLKRRCEDWNNYNDSDFDPTKVPGQGWYNLSRYYNGAGRLDPKYPDPFRIYLSTDDHVTRDISDGKWADELEKKLVAKAKEISDDHEDVRILEYAILDPDHKNITGEYMGAKVLESLVVGIPFIAGLSGDSVTSGHDNMFMSTYPMQLQSRLRKWWTDIGNKGAAFFVRNFAVGGGVGSNTQGFMPTAMTTETFPNRLHKLHKILEDNYDLWFRNGGYPIRKMDLSIFEYRFTEGRGTWSSRELHMREAAYLGAIWGVINAVKGVDKVSNACKKWEDLYKNMVRDWHLWNRRYDEWKFIKEEYLQKMGLVAIEPDYGMTASCPLYKNGTVRLDANSHHEDDGEIPDGQLYAYTPWYFKVNWHPNSRGHRVMSDIISYWMINSAITFLRKYKEEIQAFKDMDGLSKYLNKKGGSWKEDILKSIVDKKYDEFVVADYCGISDRNESAKEFMQYNDYCESIPFALTNAKPMIYNTHNLLNEYVFYESPKNYDEFQMKFIASTPQKRDFNEYVQSKGWKWVSMDNIVSIDRKEGTEGNMDTFWHLTPNVAFFKDKLNKFKDANDLDGFHQYLIENKIYIQFVVKTPKYGSGRIKIFTEFYCNEYVQNAHLVNVYVNKLDDVQHDDEDDELGEIIKSKYCIIKGLELDTKYVVTYVPYNITAPNVGKGKPSLDGYYIMFLAAY